MGKKKKRARNPTMAALTTMSTDGWEEVFGSDPKSISTRQALNSSTYYACMQIRCNSIAKMPIDILRRKENGGTGVERSHPAVELLRLRPNRFMSISDLLWATEFQRLDNGNAYWYIQYENGKAEAIYPLDSRKVTIWIEEGILDKPRSVYYQYDDPQKGTLYYTADQICHFKNFSLDGIQGQSIRSYIASTILNENAATEVMSGKYESGLQDPIIVQYVGDSDKANDQAIVDKFTRLGGSKNAGKVIPIPTMFNVSQLETKFVNSQFFELQGLGSKRIANAFGVKSFQLNDMASGTFQNIEQQNRAYYSETMQNVLNVYEQELNHVLFSREEKDAGYSVRFDTSTLLRLDIESRYKTYSEGIASGFLLRSEAREQEGLSFLPDTDFLTVQNGAVLPLSQVGIQYGGGREQEKGGNSDEK
jgi:HK97 family phage portal protein